jgi:hypothetical protein
MAHDPVVPETILVPDFHIHRQVGWQEFAEAVGTEKAETGSSCRDRFLVSWLLNSQGMNSANL